MEPRPSQVEKQISRLDDSTEDAKPQLPLMHFTIDHPRPSSSMRLSLGENFTTDRARLRRPSTVAEVALRGPRESMAVEVLEKASSSRRASHAAFLATAPCHKKPVVEHVVFLKIKPDADPEQKSALWDAVHELRKLDGVMELTIGAALSVQFLTFALGRSN